MIALIQWLKKDIKYESTDLLILEFFILGLYVVLFREDALFTLYVILS